jgi:hypothetical protein
MNRPDLPFKPTCFAIPTHLLLEVAHHATQRTTVPDVTESLKQAVMPPVFKATVAQLR